MARISQTSATAGPHRASTATKPGSARPKAPAGPISEDERRRMIAESAYFRAAQRGFAGGDPVADWLSAETEINARLMAVK